MKKLKKQMAVNCRDSYVLGDRTFAAITAVEGISLSTVSKNRMASMKKRNLTSEQKRDEVIRAYAGNKSR